MEQVDAVLAAQPQLRIAGARDAARDAERIVAPETRHVDVRIGREGRPVALVAEAPGHAREAVFDLGAAELRLAFGEICDRIEAIERDAGAGIGDDALAGRRTQARAGEDDRNADQQRHNPWLP